MEEKLKNIESVKIVRIFKLLRLLIGKNEISKSTDWVLDKLACKEKTLERDLKELKVYFPDQITTYTRERKTYYKVFETKDLLFEFLSKTDDVTWIIQFINETDKEFFKELEDDLKKKLENIVGKKRDIFLYHNSPFEELQDEDTKQFFVTLKHAIKERKYQNIDYHYNNYRKFEEVQCLKLIFMENNWYVAVATQEKKIFFLRIPFIKKIRASSNTASYQLAQLNRYIDFFKTFQNPMSLYGKEKHIAHILALPDNAKYFKPNMKKFLSSQTIIRENSDGSIEFTLEYTQPLEVLPLIKRWLPSLKILSPKSLEDALRADLEAYLK